jgi:hypothetical protein
MRGNVPPHMSTESPNLSKVIYKFSESYNKHFFLETPFSTQKCNTSGDRGVGRTIFLN